MLSEVVLTRLFVKVAIAILAISSIAACSPEVGSDEWCSDLKEKPKGEWTANELKEFTANCIFK